MLSVRLYTKEDCGLCDKVKQELARLQGDYPHQLTEVDIRRDTAVFEKYKYLIPIVQIGEIQLEAPISRQELASAFQAVAGSEVQGPSA